MAFGLWLYLFPQAAIELNAEAQARPDRLL